VDGFAVHGGIFIYFSFQITEAMLAMRLYMKKFYFFFDNHVLEKY